MLLVTITVAGVAGITVVGHGCSLYVVGYNNRCMLLVVDCC